MKFFSSVLRLVCAAVALTTVGIAWGQTVYTCTDPKITTDHEIDGCKGVQTVRVGNGTPRVVPPRLTPKEVKEQEARARDAAIKEEEHRQLVKRDNELLARYSDESAHGKAREAALQPYRKQIEESESRLGDLAKKRAPLDVKAAFFERDPMPQDLKTDIAANKASADAAKDVLRKSQQELPTPVST